MIIIMSYFSTDVEGIREAGFDLMVQNAEHLIKFIYQNTDKSPYDNPEVRIGLVIKILIRSNTNYTADLLQPVVDDMQNLLSDQDYLCKFDDPSERRNALSKELTLINKFMELDETISLNTLHYLPLKGVM